MPYVVKERKGKRDDKRREKGDRKMKSDEVREAKELTGK